jgi:hypothetical protein
MPDDQLKNPIPALNYFSEQRSPALDALVRLVLLAAAGYGCCDALFYAVTFFGGWPPISVSVIAVVTLSLIASWLIFAVSCVGVATIGAGRLTAIFSPFAVIPWTRAISSDSPF